MYAADIVVLAHIHGLSNTTALDNKEHVFYFRYEAELSGSHTSNPIATDRDLERCHVRENPVP